MYLVDTNVWLERLLDQARSDEVGQFLDRIASDSLFMTDFAFHSIAIVLLRLDRREALLRFVQDAFVDGAIRLLRLDPEDTDQILRAAERFNLDFDDAYHYAVAEKNGLDIVSFDSDFNRTARGRKTPAEVLQS